MNPYGRMPRSTLFGVGGFFTLGALLFVSPWKVEEAGALEPVEARSPEEGELHRLAPGETFGDVLFSQSIDGNEHARVLGAFSEHASARRMRPGTEILVRRLREDGALRGIDVRLNPDESVRLDRDVAGGWSASLQVTPVVTDTIAGSAAIESLLWTAVLTDPGLESVPRADRIRLIDQLDRIFQWRIDFTRQIHPGDHYKVVVERQVRPDGTMRSATVLAAEIVNRSRPVRAVWFDPDGDGKGTWYDEDGNSVRRSFLRRPVEFSRISSRMSSARMHPVLNRIRAHNGVDFAAARGTPVYATADGVVTFRGVSGGFGNMVEIRHANGFATRYAHLDRFASGLRVGQRVAQEEVIGTVGSTGLATGPHVHYEMRRNGRLLDPLSADLPAGDPVPADARAAWERQREARMHLLETLPATPTVRILDPGVRSAEDDGA